jgi:acyl-CoA reductase-like NAD-dependent aldehyde dehydrogenase
MYVAESKRLTHQGAKKIMATAVGMAGQAGTAISCAIVDGGDWETDLRIAKAAVESIGVNWK